MGGQTARLTLTQSDALIEPRDPAGLAWHIGLASPDAGDARAVLVGVSSGDVPVEDLVGPVTHLYVGHLLSDTAASAEPPPPASALYLVAFDVPDADVLALEEWYASEHVSQMMTVPGWRRIQCARVHAAAGRPFTHLALHWIDEPGVLDTPARKAASLGPKRDLVSGRDWFTKGGRWVYEPLHRD